MIPDAARPPALMPLSTGQVVWRPWAARDSARALNRPIFLFLYTQRSFWCREMVRGCFADGELAREIVRGTVPIRVDVDRRPDLAERFGMGAWPSVVFLTPEQAWITGGTSADADDLQRLLRRVRVFFDTAERREDLERQRGYLNERAVRDRRRLERLRERPSEALLSRLADSTRAAVARGGAPGAESLLFLLEYGRVSGDGAAERAAAGALSGLPEGRLRDKDGLYFLASLTPDTVLVDPEKHLGKNAGWLVAFSLASQLSGRPAYREAAMDLGRALRDRLYVPPDSLFAAGFAGFSPGPEEVPALSPDGARVDTAFYSGWNALAASGYAALYRVSRDARDLSLGRAVLYRVVRRMVGPGGGVLRFEGAEVPLLLEDQALAARAALDLYAADGREADLRLARRLADGMLARFADPSGGLRDRWPEPGPAHMPSADHALPSGNGVAAQVLLRLFALTDEARYREAAGRILTALTGPALDSGMDAGALGRALGFYVRPTDFSGGVDRPL